MQLCVVGIDHSTAPIAIRERLAFGDEQIAPAITRLSAHDAHGVGLSEAAIISTCNRVEVYGVAPDNASARVAAFLADFHQVDAAWLGRHLFAEQNESAALHLCATAAGLNSLVLGEAQIQGQVRGAYEKAHAVGATGPVLAALFRHALAAGRRVRHETTIGQGPASVSQAGVELARQWLGNASAPSERALRGRCVLLVGSGEVSELAARNLRAYGAGELLVVNRTLAHAEALAERYDARALPLELLPEALMRADIVISATAAPRPLILGQHVEAALAARNSYQWQHTAHTNTSTAVAYETQAAVQMLLIDLAVPRDIAPEVAQVPGARLYTVDDLQGIVHDTLARRREVVVAADMIVAAEAAAFDAWLRSQTAQPALTRMRRHAEELRQHELQRALHNMGDLSPQQQHTLDALTRALVNRLLHNPTLHVKQGAAHGDGERLAAIIDELFSPAGNAGLLNADD